MKEPEFCGAMQRRVQTEGRVGLLRNVFMGGIPLAKGFERRQVQVSWAVLAHNLWVADRLPWRADRRKQAKAACPGPGQIQREARKGCRHGSQNGQACPKTGVFGVSGAGVPALHRIRWVFPSLQNRLSPQNSGKFKKPGSSGQARGKEALGRTHTNIRH
jgi:hypothetical protein